MEKIMPDFSLGFSLYLHKYYMTFTEFFSVAGDGPCLILILLTRFVDE